MSNQENSTDRTNGTNSTDKLREYIDRNRAKNYPIAMNFL